MYIFILLPKEFIIFLSTYIYILFVFIIRTKNCHQFSFLFTKYLSNIMNIDNVNAIWIIETPFKVRTQVYSKGNSNILG